MGRPSSLRLPATLRQPYPWTATVLGDELDAAINKRTLDHRQRSGMRVGACLDGGDGVF
jgi:hypothetical protein